MITPLPWKGEQNPAYVLLSTLFVAVPSGCVNRNEQLKTRHSHPKELL
ncbi:hypothetical protein SynSYN20_00259 [Synechococcus sp. SYN20]|nr:hypothetical protein SynSYN20_00259 [Synechococcus sp. SYN20]